MTEIKQQVRFCTTGDGGRIAIAMVGTGQPLLRAAHWLSRVELDVCSPVWMHWLRELSREYSYIRYDQRGCGLSDRVPASLSLEAWINDLDTVVNSLGLKRFALFGTSQGGATAVAYAVRRPERVSRLVLLGAFARGRLRRGRTTQEEAETLMNLMRIGWKRDNPAFRQFFARLRIPDGTLEQHRGFNDLGRLSASLETVMAIREAVHQLDITTLAEAVRVPTLVCHAREDAVVPFEEGRYLAALIPSARFVPLDGRNHMLLESEPAWTQFLTELRAFISDGSGNTSLRHRLSAIAQLTPAENQVLGLLARGLQNSAIAAQLGKGEKTVRNQVSNILRKLQAHTRAEAVALARDAGIGVPPGRAPQPPAGRTQGGV